MAMTGASASLSGKLEARAKRFAPCVPALSKTDKRLKGAAGQSVRPRSIVSVGSPAPRMVSLKRPRPAAAGNANGASNSSPVPVARVPAPASDAKKPRTVSLKAIKKSRDVTGQLGQAQPVHASSTTTEHGRRRQQQLTRTKKQVTRINWTPASSSLARGAGSVNSRGARAGNEKDTGTG